jgi:hypothetical protein
MALHGDPRRHLRPRRLVEIRRSGGALRGKGIASAGLVLSYIGLALGIMGIPLLFSVIQSGR